MIIKILPDGASKKLFMHDEFLKKIFDKNIIIFGKNSFKKKAVVNILIKNYFRLKDKFFFKRKKNQFYNKHIINEKTNDLYTQNYLKIIFPNKNSNLTTFLKTINSRLSNLSKFKKNKYVVILYQVSKLNTIKQRKLFHIINRHLNHFFFIFTTNSLKKIITNIKHKTFCFSLLEWNFLWIGKQNLIEKKDFNVIFQKKKYNRLKNVFLKSKISNLIMISRSFEPFFFLFKIWKIFFFFHFKNNYKYICSQNQTIKILRDYCNTKVFLKLSLNITNLYEIGYFLYKIYVAVYSKKTAYLTISILFYFLYKNILKILV